MKRAICTFILGAVGLSLQGCGLFGRDPEPVRISRASYQPFGAAYRGVVDGRTTQYFDDQPTETDFGFEYFVSAEVAAAEGGLVTTLVLDSVILEEGAAGGISQAQVDAARGSVFRADLSPSGRLNEFSGAEQAGGLAREIADRILEQFFPIIPEQGAEAGSTWVDTVQTKMFVNGLKNNVNVVSAHSATEWTPHHGERALHIVTTSEYTFSGVGSQAGRSFTLDGNGRRHIHQYLSESGRYLGFVSADTSEAEARIPETDMVIPIHQTRLDSLSVR